MDMFIEGLGWTPLHYMVEKGELDSVRELLGQGTAINAIDKYQRTALSIAACNNNLPLVELLVNEGANVNEGSPLHYSCEKGHTDIVIYLVKNGALVNLEKENNYPLLIAARKGNLEVTKILIERGVEIHVLNENEESALHLACNTGNKELISFLIDSGSHLSTKDRYSLTPLYICLLRKRDKPELVKTLLEKGTSIDLCDDLTTYLHESEHPESTLELIKHGADVNAQNIYKETPLYTHKGSHPHHLKCARVLLENGADPNIAARGGWCPLHFAAANGHLSYVQELLKFGANVNVASTQHITPLHLAAQNGNLDIVKILLEHNSLVDVPMVNIRDVNAPLVPHFVKEESISDNATAFSLTTDSGHEEICSFLAAYATNNSDPSSILKKGKEESFNMTVFNLITSNNLEEIGKMEESSLEITDSVGWTSLHHSVAKSLYDMSYQLIKKGLSVNAVDKHQRTPLSLAAARGDLSILTLLLDNEADVNLGLALHYAVDNASLDCIKELIKRKCELNITDYTEAKNSPLLRAASDNRTDIVNLLLDNNADPNFTNKWGETPLHLICRSTNLEATQALLSRGAKVNALDTFNGTPLCEACLFPHLDTIKLLLRNNADTNVKDKFERTPLHDAVDSSSATAVEELLKAGALVNVTDDSGKTPLILATENVIILKILIENGADVNYSTSDGWTPLHHSVYERSLECVKELLKNGAKVNCVSAEFVLPIYLASIQGDAAIVKELLDNGSYIDPFIINSGVIKYDHRNLHLTKRYLIEPGNTPLIGAAFKGHLDVVKLLCASGASLDAVNCKGNTASHEARANRQEAMVSYLVSLEFTAQLIQPIKD